MNRMDLKNIHATLYENGVLDTSTSAEGKLCLKSLAELIGFTWISQPSRQGEALAADLNGLKRPLLEKGQLRLDFSFTANQDRQRISAQSSTPQEYYEFYTRFMYGLADALQVYLLAQVQPKYAYLTDYGTSATHYLYPISPQYGLGLTYRPKNNFEVYLDVTLSPSLDSKVSSYDAGGPTSINYSEQESTFVTLGATVLW